MPHTIQRLREAAFGNQNGRCYYCSAPMWLHTPQELRTHGLVRQRARPLRCTAEHLVARMEGGQDTADNVVAACELCNRRRHARKRLLTLAQYRALVQRRLAMGRWHAPEILALTTRR
ncbi:HNH endonuclease [Azohydromonas lata]|uniref:HNH endonuclease n=1 Tax=Azohydromonas lata TaxID=45677 RepID=A0ABU5I7C1_9BURK|nr:HNH endonuclease [Azohydromonas lata]MDZ5454992.1 HNH endonuclease [Azohydromonas lata]